MLLQFYDHLSTSRDGSCHEVTGGLYPGKNDSSCLTKDSTRVNYTVVFFGNELGTSMIYVEGNGRKSSLFILPPRRLHHPSVNSKPMRILRAYLLTLEGVNPGQEYKIAQQGLISGGEITVAPTPNLSSVSTNHIHGNSRGSSLIHSLLPIMSHYQPQRPSLQTRRTETSHPSGCGRGDASTSMMKHTHEPNGQARRYESFSQCGW